MPKIQFHTEGNVRNPLTGKINPYKDWLLQIADTEEGSIDEIHYIFCDDDYILKINRDFLQHDYYTDIITFPYSDGKKEVKSDIYISIDTVRSNAEEYAQTFEEELKRVIVHGLLHLLGYNDKTEADARVMRQKENHYIALL